MSLRKIEPVLSDAVASLRRQGTSKGAEQVITNVRAARAGFGPRYLLRGCGGREFLRMNANAYLGLGLHPDVIAAEAAAVDRFGTGPGAVRFISGTYEPHIVLEEKLAAFHRREAALIMSAAYATVMGVLPQLLSEQTLVVSDALNHNCIINAIRLSRPAHKAIYPHLDMRELDNILAAHAGKARRACVVTDGVFSMRGDHAPLHEISAVCASHEPAYPEGVITVVDDSHGVGAFGASGRGTEEVAGTRADVLVATLGKALGVNGGYVVAGRALVDYLRETAPFYIYSNPITPGEAAAAACALDVLNSAQGRRLLDKMRVLAGRLRDGLTALGFETIGGEHPIVPMLIRDTARTRALARYLFDNNVLVTGLNYPVVPKGEEEIRLQVCANHTEQDIDMLLDVLRDAPGDDTR